MSKIIASAEDAPKCGCRIQAEGTIHAFMTPELCLYPEAVELNERLQRRLTLAEALIDRLVLESGWMGAKAVQDAEEFLRPTKERES